jgi:hypothetical protein
MEIVSRIDEVVNLPYRHYCRATAFLVDLVEILHSRYCETRRPQ